MSLEASKKFLLKPILLVVEGLRKFYEDFSAVFSRISKPVFF